MRHLFYYGRPYVFKLAYSHDFDGDFHQVKRPIIILKLNIRGLLCLYYRNNVSEPGYRYIRTLEKAAK